VGFEPKTSVAYGINLITLPKMDLDERLWLVGCLIVFSIVASEEYL
jgi:hypothetical protein